MSATIEEILKPFQSENMIVKIIKAEQLRSQLDSLAETNSDYEFFVYLVNRYCKKFVFPEDVLNLCNELGIITLHDLMTWGKSVNGAVIMPILEPEIDIELTVKKTMSEIKEVITSFCNCENPCRWNFGDPNYYIMSKDDLKEILAKCPIDKKPYIVSTYDCEDFARTTKSWCSLHGLGNIAFAYCEVNFYAENKYLFSHGINLVPLIDESIVCVEPQSDRIWSADSPEFGFGADEMKLRFVQF